MAPKVLVKEQRLQRQVMINQEVYIELQKQYEAARIQEKNDQPLIEVVMRPEVAIKRAAPSVGPILLLASFVGLIGGLLLTLVSSWFAKNFLHSDDTEHQATKGHP
jgi:uncharacterized protein involved in exopolysaccharide biosynthesis